MHYGLVGVQLQLNFGDEDFCGWVAKQSMALAPPGYTVGRSLSFVIPGLVPTDTPQTTKHYEKPESFR